MDCFRRNLLLFTINEAVLLSTIPAVAQVGEDSDEAKAEAQAHRDRGVELYNAEDYMGALDEYLAAYKIEHEFNLLYDIAECYQKTGQEAKALEYYEQYLKDGEKHGLNAETKSKIASVIAELKEVLCEVTLDISPVDATVILDGKKTKYSQASNVKYVEEGEHTVLVQKDGWASISMPFIASKYKQEPIEISLKKIKADSAEDDVSVDEERDEGAEDYSDEDSLAWKSTKSPRKKMSPGLFAVFSSLAIGGGIAAVIVGILDKKHNEDFLELRNDIMHGTYSGYNADLDYHDAQVKGKQLNTALMVTVGFAAGSAALAILFAPFTDFKRKKHSLSGDELAVHVKVQPSAHGGYLEVSF